MWNFVLQTLYFSNSSFLYFIAILVKRMQVMKWTAHAVI